MTPTLPNGAILSVIFDGSVDGQALLLTMHYRLLYNAPTPAPEFPVLMANFYNELNAIGGIHELYSNCLSKDVTDLGIFIQPVYPTRYAGAEYVPTRTEGQDPNAALPPGTAHAILCSTFLTGRTQRSVKHIGGVPSIFSENGLVSAAGRAVYQVFAEELFLDKDVTIGTDDYDLEPLIFHKAAPADSPVIVAASVQDTTRTMRRRVVGRGI